MSQFIKVDMKCCAIKQGIIGLKMGSWEENAHYFLLGDSIKKTVKLKLANSFR